MEDAGSELQAMKEERKSLKLRIEERKRKVRDLQKEKEDAKAKKSQTEEERKISPVKIYSTPKLPVPVKGENKQEKGGRSKSSKR